MGAPITGMMAAITTMPLQRSAVAKALKDMQVGGVENLVGSTTTDVTQAQREWVDFLRGKF